MELLQGAFHTYKTETEVTHRAEFRDEKLKLSQKLKEQYEKEMKSFGKMNIHVSEPSTYAISHHIWGKRKP